MAFIAEKTIPRPAQSTPWSLSQVAGRLVEISSSDASAALTVSCDLIVEAHERREPVGWIGLSRSCFYPPDVAQIGIDLAALMVVRLTKPDSIARAGEKLLRSGGFGVLVLDLGKTDIPMPLQARLNGLAQHHNTAILCLTEKPPRFYSQLAGFTTRACREKARNGRRLHLLSTRSQGQTAWSHLALRGALWCPGWLAPGQLQQRTSGKVLLTS
jgi:recombination protein RecA